MKKAVISMLCLLLLSACNTVEGFGKDVKKVGQKVEGAAAKHKD
jgi:predicted small secreted protein